MSKSSNFAPVADQFCFLPSSSSLLYHNAQHSRKPITVRGLCLKKLNQLTVKDMRSVARAYFTYKVANDMVPDTLAIAGMFLIVYEVSEKSIRQSSDFHIPVELTAPGRRFLACRLLSSLPHDNERIL